MSQKINHIIHFGYIKNPETVLSMFRDEKNILDWRSYH